MKISNLQARDSSNIALQKANTQGLKSSTKTKEAQSTKTASLGNLKNENIKETNLNIGKLQVLQKSLDSLESPLRKAQKALSTDSKEQIAEAREQAEKIIKSSTFNGQKVFGVSVKDSKNNVVLEPVVVDTSFISADKRELEIFSKNIQESKAQVKEALNALSKDAQENIQTLSKAKNLPEKDTIANEQDSGKIASFFKKFGDFLRGAQASQKVDSERVSQLLT